MPLSISEFYLCLYPKKPLAVSVLISRVTKETKNISSNPDIIKLSSASLSSDMQEEIVINLAGFRQTVFRGGKKENAEIRKWAEIK